MTKTEIQSLIEDYKDRLLLNDDLEIVEDFVLPLSVENLDEMDTDERQALAESLGFRHESEDVFTYIEQLASDSNITEEDLLCLLECVTESQFIMNPSEIMQHIDYFFEDIGD